METLDYKRQFTNAFDSVCRGHPKFAIWNDFIYMSAYALSNACNYRQDREDDYLRIVKKYSKEEVNKIVEMLSFTVLALEENREQDFLGQLYMHNGFGDERKGQHFTPYDIAMLMPNLAGSERNENERYITLNDSACGSGVMLIAFSNALIKSGANLHLELFVVANDIDPCIALMCYVQLSLLGCAGYVTIRNTITEPVTGDVMYPPDDAFLTPLFFHPVWKLRRSLGIKPYKTTPIEEVIYEHS